MSIETLVAKSIGPDAVVLLADPGGHSSAQVSPLIANASTIYLLVGPEGGFTACERDQLATVASASVSLGDGVLRIETAAVAMVALVGSACSP
jgi:16S rRNA (uracil1498-N3)-methyltransferase